MDFHPHDIAEHLTMIEYGIFSDIRLSEITSQAWNNKVHRREKAPNVVAMIERSNKVSFWVATEILSTANVNERTAVLKRFIDIAQQCIKYNNFNTLVEVLCT
jgi:son of sevenless-like protein